MQRCEQNGRQRDAAAHSTGRPHRGQLTKRGAANVTTGCSLDHAGFDQARDASLLTSLRGPARGRCGRTRDLAAGSHSSPPRRAVGAAPTLPLDCRRRNAQGGFPYALPFSRTRPPRRGATRGFCPLPLPHQYLGAKQLLPPRPLHRSFSQRQGSWSCAHRGNRCRGTNTRRQALLLAHAGAQRRSSRSVRPGRQVCGLHAL